MDADEIFGEDNSELMRLHNRLLYAQNRTVEPVPTPGGMRYKVAGSSTLYNTLGDAIRARKAVGLSQNEVFSPGKGIVSMPTQGPMFYPFLERLSQDLGPGETLIREARHIDRARDFDSIVSASTANGLPVIDNDIATLVRLKKADGSLATEEEIRRRLRDLYGYETDLDSPTAKVGKRTKALTSSRPIGSLERGKKYQVKIFKDADEIAYEGMSVLNPRVIRDQADILDARAAAIEKQIKDGTPNARQLRANVRGLQEQAAELRRQAANAGGMFNIRMMGLHVWDKDMPLGVSTLDGQIKGNVRIGHESVFEGQENIDIITHAKNIKTETKMTKARFLSLDPRKASTQVFLDIQTLSANRDLFDVNRLTDYTQSQVRRLLKELETGVDVTGAAGRGTQLGKLYHAMKIASTEALDPSDPDYESALAAQRYAKDIVSAIDIGGGKLNDPYLAKQMVKNYYGFLRQQKGGMDTPHFLVPDALRAEIIGTRYQEIAGSQSRLQKNLVSGSVAYDELTESWVMREDDILKFYHAFGGFDQDDTIVGLLRWDEASKQVKLVSYRQPNALGEIGVFDISSSDAAVEKVLRDRGLTDQADRIRQAREALESGELPPSLRSFVESQINDIVRQNIEHIEDTAPIAQRSIRPILDATGKVMGYENQHRALRYEADLVDEINTEMKSNAQLSVHDQLEKARAGKKALGGYVNTRMIIDEVLSAAPKEAFGEGVFSYIPQESAIDFNILGGSVHGGIESLTAQMQEELGEQMAYARAGYRIEGGALVKVSDEGFDVGFDPYMLRLKGYYATESLNAGIERANARLLGETDYAGEAFSLREMTGKRSLTLADDDFSHPMAFIGRSMDRFQDILGAEDDISREAMRIAGYSDEIMKELYSVDELDAAERLIETYRDSIRRNVSNAAQLTDDEIEKELDAFGEVLDRSGIQWQKVHADTVKALTEFFDDSGREGNQLYRVLGAAMKITQRRGGSGHMFHQISGNGPSMSEISTRAVAHMTGFDANDAVADLFDVNLNQRYTVDDITDALGEVPPKPGAHRAMAREVADRFAESTRKTYERFGSQHIDNLMKIPGVKGGLIGAAGLMAFSALYQKNRDRTQDDLAGPPLLPGGSAYEPDYSVPPMPEQIGSMNRNSSSGGVTFKIITSGNYDPDAFRSQVEAVTGVQASGTIYNGRRPVSDIFGAINESF